MFMLTLRRQLGRRIAKHFRVSLNHGSSELSQTPIFSRIVAVLFGDDVRFSVFLVDDCRKQFSAELEPMQEQELLVGLCCCVVDALEETD